MGAGRRSRAEVPHLAQGGARNVIPLDVHLTHFLLQKHLTSGTELILIGWKIVPNEEHVQCDHRFASQPLANEPLHSSQLFDTSSESARHNFTMYALSCATFSGLPGLLHCVGPELRYIFWPPKEARKCSAAQGPHSEVVPRAFWGLASKSCDECKGSFARGCEAKRWSH